MGDDDNAARRRLGAASRGKVGDDGPPLSTIARVAFGVLRVVYAVLAALLVINPGLLDPVVPFELARLSGRFIGSWATFLAVLAIFAAVRNKSREAWIPGLALTLWPLAGLAAALRTSGEMAADRRIGYLAALLVLLVLGAIACTMAARRESAPAGEPDAETSQLPA